MQGTEGCPRRLDGCRPESPRGEAGGSLVLDRKAWNAGLRGSAWPQGSGEPHAGVKQGNGLASLCFGWLVAGQECLGSSRSRAGVRGLSSGH